MKYFFLALFLSGCSGFFYQPSREVYSSPEKYNLEYENIYFPSSDGTKLHGWLLKSADSKEAPKSTIVFFHGNAENITTHYQGIAWITRKGHDVFIFDYRGYGQSEGSPGQKGIYQDALAALDQAFHLHQQRNSKKFIVYGQSLGGIISMRAIHDFKHKQQVDLLVQDSTFSSYKDLAFQKMKEFWPSWPFSPLAYLTFSDAYASAPFVEKLAPTPLLVIHGDNDEVVPYQFGEEIFNKARAPKWLWKVRNGVHIDAFFYHDQAYRTRFVDFIENQLGQPNHF